MPVFWIIFVNTTLTLALTVSAAVRRPELRYRLIAGLAVCAFVASLHQAVKGEYTPLAVITTLVLAVAVLQIVFAYLSRISKINRH